MSNHAITEEQFSEWKDLAGSLPDDKKQELEAMIEGQEGKPAEEVQSEFESFLSSLPMNFRTGLSKIVDVRNLTPEQLRGILITNSLDGMDEVIRAAQYGDQATSMNDRNIGQGRDREEMEEDMRRDSREHDPLGHGRLPHKHVGEAQLGALTPSSAGTPGQENEKGTIKR